MIGSPQHERAVHATFECDQSNRQSQFCRWDTLVPIERKGFDQQWILIGGFPHERNTSPEICSYLFEGDCAKDCQRARILFEVLDTFKLLCSTNFSASGKPYTLFSHYLRRSLFHKHSVFWLAAQDGILLAGFRDIGRCFFINHSRVSPLDIL